MPALSVVIPVYNVKDYLKDCLDSIISQSFSDFEVILVDDGSTDGSGDLCDIFAGQDSRIQVIHQQNRGLSGARNSGIQKVTGQWLAFVDSDDILPTDAFENMLSCVNEKVDVIIGRIGSFVESTDNIKNDRDDFSQIDVSGLSGQEAFCVLLKQVSAPLWSACRSYYRTSMWKEHGFLYEEGVTSEDMRLTPRIQMMAQGIALCNHVIYYYRTSRSGSIMTGKNIKRELDFCDNVVFYQKFFEEHPQYHSVEKPLMRQFGNILYGMLRRLSYYSKQEKTRVKKAILPFAEYIKDCNLGKRWKPFYYLLGKRLYCEMIILRNKGR